MSENDSRVVPRLGGGVGECKGCGGGGAGAGCARQIGRGRGGSYQSRRRGGRTLGNMRVGHLKAELDELTLRDLKKRARAEEGIDADTVSLVDDKKSRRVS